MALSKEAREELIDASLPLDEAMEIAAEEYEEAEKERRRQILEQAKKGEEMVSFGGMGTPYGVHTLYFDHGEYLVVGYEVGGLGQRCYYDPTLEDDPDVTNWRRFADLPDVKPPRRMG